MKFKRLSIILVSLIFMAALAYAGDCDGAPSVSHVFQTKVTCNDIGLSTNAAYAPCIYDTPQALRDAVNYSGRMCTLKVYCDDYERSDGTWKVVACVKYAPECDNVCATQCLCKPNSKETASCGLCGTKTRTCSMYGDSWSPWSACTGQGVCSPGQKQTTPCGTDAGECKSGTQTKTCSGSCYWGGWGPCTGSVGPKAETCDGKDNDCDGKIDEDFECVYGTPGCNNDCTTEDECEDNSDCDDGKFCNGQEKCINGECVDGTGIDCDPFDLDPIGECNYNPDGFPATWDFFIGFESFCDEGQDKCTTGTVEITSTCDMDNCNAECIDETNCGPHFHLGGDYCYFDGECTGPPCCECDYVKEYCPPAGTIKDGDCYWGERDCRNCPDGCTLNVTPMGCHEVCHPDLGPVCGCDVGAGDCATAMNAAAPSKSLEVIDNTECRSSVPEQKTVCGSEQTASVQNEDIEEAMNAVGNGKPVWVYSKKNRGWQVYNPNKPMLSNISGLDTTKYRVIAANKNSVSIELLN